MGASEALWAEGAVSTILSVILRAVRGIIPSVRKGCLACIRARIPTTTSAYKLDMLQSQTTHRFKLRHLTTARSVRNAAGLTLPLWVYSVSSSQKTTPSTNNNEKGGSLSLRRQFIWARAKDIAATARRRLSSDRFGIVAGTNIATQAKYSKRACGAHIVLNGAFLAWTPLLRLVTSRPAHQLGPERAGRGKLYLVDCRVSLLSPVMAPSGMPSLQHCLLGLIICAASCSTPQVVGLADTSPHVIPLYAGPWSPSSNKSHNLRHP